MKKLLLPLLLLSLVSCFHNKPKMKLIHLMIEVQADQRKPINKNDLGPGALDYSKLDGILIELIPKGFDVSTSKILTHRVVFESQGNHPQYLAIRPQDSVLIENRSQRPIILDSYDNLPGFPVKINSPKKGEKSFVAELPLSKLCRNAVIFDRSGRYKLVVTCNKSHKAYVRSHEKKSFGLNRDNPLLPGEWTLRLSHPRLLDHEEVITLKPEGSHIQPVIRYSLPDLNSSNKGLPKVP